MLPSTTYYARVRHRATNGIAGAWSPAVSFKTKAKGLVGLEEKKLLAADPAANDLFGVSVSLSSDGNTALIGAYQKTGTAGTYQGAAYVFARTGGVWSQQAKLTHSDPAANDYFGYSVSLSSDGNTALIGAYYKTGSAGSSQGAAYVFIRNGGTWTQQAKLLASDPARGDQFGFSVSLSGDGNTALVGANYKSDTYSIQGAAYVFTLSDSSWTQQAKLLASDPVGNDNFGRSVSLSNDAKTALIGARNKNGTYNGQGAAYIFARVNGTWSQQAKLMQSDPAANDYFGASTSLSSDGNTALIGANYKSDTYSRQGAVYVFARVNGTWSQQAKLLHGDPAANDYFGWSVSLSNDGNSALIGAYNKSGAYSYQGAAYVFTRSGSGWTQQAKFTQSDPGSSDRFGFSVQVTGDDNKAIIGAYSKTGTLSTQGAAYIFS